MSESTTSASALLVSKGLVFLSRDSKRGSLVPKESAELLLSFIRTLTHKPHYGKHLTFPPYRFMVRTLVNLAYPGMILNYALRKRVIEAATVEHLQNGARQVVVIGAGFDTLTLRLSRQFPNARFFEIDKPETQSAKRSAVLATSLQAPIEFVPADLSVSKLQDVLTNHPRFDKNAVSIFILEGVSMYLSEATIADLFRQIQQLSAKGSLFAFTFMDDRGRDRLLSRLWQKRHERMEGFAMTPERMSAFVKLFGMEQRSLHLFQEMQKPYVSTKEWELLMRTRGEHVCIAERTA
ncbi:MAG: SAM-dependent methyltransferase [Proteobacteria bacterium]|nr:SAM-dependent methyltransferase [Pseudomonadota bacterium]